MLVGVSKFYFNAVTTALISWIVQPENDVAILTSSNGSITSGQKWSVCRLELPNNSTFCDDFDAKMNHALTRISQGLRAMKLSTIRLHELASVSDFNPPDPNDHVQKQIDELKQDIIDLQGEIDAMDKKTDLGELRAAMALMQEEIAALNTAVDHAAKQATDKLQPEIDQLTASFDTVAANLFSLKLTIANLESALEQTQIVDIVAGIISGPESGPNAGTVFRYEHGVFQRSTAETAMSTIVTLGYQEILKNQYYFLNFLNFLSQLNRDEYKLWGYQNLYYAVLTNGHLYNAAQPFILAYKISQLYKSSNVLVASEAKNFLTKVVHPVISKVVFQSSLPRSYEGEFYIPQLYCIDGDLKISQTPNSFIYDFEGMDTLSLEIGCALTSFPGDSEANICYLLFRGNSLITKIPNVSLPRSDWTKPRDFLLWIEAKCDLYDCSQSIPPVVSSVYYQIFDGKMACPSYKVYLYGNLQ